MKDLFVNYNQASELKELGFDEPCLAVFNDSKQFRINSESRNWNDNVKNGDTTSAPLYQQAFRFFRDKKLSDSCICRYQGRNDGGIYYYYVINHDFGIEETKHYKEGFFSYEEAESACLDKLIEIAKTK